MEELAFRSALVCQMLGNTTRYRILKLLAQTPMTPGQLCEQLAKPPSVISNQLTKLRHVGLVRFKRQPEGLTYWPKVKGVAKLFAYLERFASQLG